MHDKIKNEIPTAMRTKDEVRLTTLRGVLAAFTNEAVALKRTPQDKLSDDEAITVIRRLVKQRKDSIDQFERGNRNDLADNERAEMKVLEEFLPAQMSEDKVREIVMNKLDQLKSTNSDATVGAIKPNIGLIVGAVMKETKGQADGSLVKKLIEEMLG